jgi:3-dehydroquinate synthase
MRTIKQNFKVQFSYGVHFTEGVFKEDNTLLRDILSQANVGSSSKVLFVIDDGVAKAHPTLSDQISEYASTYSDVFHLAASPILVLGGEEVKNDKRHLQLLLDSVNEFGICRHSYIVAIGGGAVLDMVGFAAAIAHRGIRHIRIPTTVLSQNDSGVGVKNGINAFGKKNFVGTFAPPAAVINDSLFLHTLNDAEWRSGISEAIKVALIKDSDFYHSIKRDAHKLVARNMAAMQQLIFRCAELHVEHIGGKDPFEFGSSRPLDFGHWSAHKLEQITDYRLRHGEAVAIGIALDVIYSKLIGMISEAECDNILDLFQKLQFDLFIPELLQQEPDGKLTLIKGLNEFREHLGGQLTIMLLSNIGTGVEVNTLNEALIIQAVGELQQKYQPHSSTTV